MKDSIHLHHNERIINIKSTKQEKKNFLLNALFIIHENEQRHGDDRVEKKRSEQSDILENYLLVVKRNLKLIIIFIFFLNEYKKIK